MEAAVVVQVIPARQELVQGVLLWTVANADASCTSKRQIHILSAKRRSSIQRSNFLDKHHPFLKTGSPVTSLWQFVLYTKRVLSGS